MHTLGTITSPSATFPSRRKGPQPYSNLPSTPPARHLATSTTACTSPTRPTSSTSIWPVLVVSQPGVVYGPLRLSQGGDWLGRLPSNRDSNYPLQPLSFPPAPEKTRHLRSMNNRLLLPLPRRTRGLLQKGPHLPSPRRRHLVCSFPFPSGGLTRVSN